MCWPSRFTHHRRGPRQRGKHNVPKLKPHVHAGVPNSLIWRLGCGISGRRRCGFSGAFRDRTRAADLSVCRAATPAASACTCLLGGCKRKLSRWGRIHGNSQLPDTEKKENNSRAGAALLTQSELSFLTFMWWHRHRVPPASKLHNVIYLALKDTNSVYFETPVGIRGSTLASRFFPALVVLRCSVAQRPQFLFLSFFIFFIYLFFCQRRGN